MLEIFFQSLIKQIITFHLNDHKLFIGKMREIIKL